MTNYLIRRIGICGLLLTSITANGYGYYAAELYRRHITEIQPNSVTQLEGYLFSSASSIPRGHSSTAITGALKRAHFKAKIQILDKVLPRKYNFESFGLDESLEERFTASLRNVLYNNTNNDLSGLQVVFQANSKALSKCVLALPVENLKDLLLSNQDIRRLILDSAFGGNYTLDPVVVAELSSVNQLAKVINFWSRSLELNYQCEGFSDALNYKPIFRLPKGLEQTHLLREGRFQALSFMEGLKYSSLFLNFPPYVRAIAQKAISENYPVTENVFLYFGACYSVRLPDQILCATSLKDRGLGVFIPKYAGSFAYVGDIEAINFPSATNLNSILSSGGGFRLVDSGSESPNYVKAEEAFYSAPPDLKLAEMLYAEALEDSISSTICNMLGRCYTLNRSTASAVALLTQATVMNQNHPYASANLALALHAHGMTNEAVEQAHLAMQNESISEWARLELKNLLNRIQ